MKNFKRIFILSSLLFSTLSFAYYKQPIPEFMDQFIIPKMDDVIPKYLQIQLRNRPEQRELNFEDLTGKDLRYRDTPTYGLVASIENLLGAPRVAERTS